MFEDVVTFVDGSVRCQKSIDGAVAFCRERQARLRLSLLNKGVPLIAAADSAGFGYALAANEEIFDQDLSTLREKLGVAGVEAHVDGICCDAAVIPSQAAARACLTDLIVIGPPSSWADDALRRHVVESLVLDAGTPVLIQSASDIPARFRHVVLGWKQSAQAAHAARALVALAEPGARIDIVTVKEEDASERTDGCAHVADYLAHHGFAAFSHVRSPDGAAAADVLEQFAISCEAELLAVGGYAHSRMRERFFGGVTQDFIASARLPVLMVG